MTNDNASSLTTLYGMASPNVRKITIMLAEVQQNYDFHHIDVFRGGQFEPEFEALNPNRKVPVLVDHISHNHEPIVIIESAAILIYLAEKHGSFLPQSEPARTIVLQWLMVQSSNIGPLLGQFNHFSFVAREGNDYAYERYQREARRLYQLLENRLKEHPYLGGSDYSIADIATYPWTLYLERHGFNKAEFPNLDLWQQQIIKRPAVIAGMKAIEAIEQADASALKLASEQDRNRFFGKI